DRSAAANPDDDTRFRGGRMTTSRTWFRFHCMRCAREFQTDRIAHECFKCRTAQRDAFPEGPAEVIELSST
ncbi:hypothetical protein, partial [Mycobacteroides abscessus]